MTIGGPTLIRLQPRANHHSISRGRTVLTTALDGSVQPEGDQGLWVYQTRMLSRHCWKVNRGAPTFCALSAIEQHHDLAYYIFAPAECDPNITPDCGAAQQAVELRVARRVGEGLDERVTLTNYTQIPTSFELALEVAADFADPAEAHGPRKQQGELSVQWKHDDTGSSLRFDYKVRHEYSHQGDAGTASLHRGIRLELKNTQQPPGYRDGAIHFRVQLKPREEWSATLRWIAQMGDKDLPLATEEDDRKRQAFQTSGTSYSSPSAAKQDLTSSVLATLAQSASDYSALRLFDLDSSDALGPTWIPAAGIPIYIGLFGRDILFSAREAASLSSAPMRGALSTLAQHIGSDINDWRDEQPGRMVHELHTSPLAALNYTPHGRYYGTVSGSFFYPSLLAELWRWTGDKELIRPLIEPALRGIRWADQYSRDESGFYKYQTRSTQGEKNQGWKDSGDAIVHADGSQVPDPLGTCEMQAYIYGSKMALSEMLDAFGERDQAARFKAEAVEFKKRFNDFFWMPGEKYLAMGIGPDNKPIRSVASDPGHCLLNGIVDDSLRMPVAERLMADDLFSGWGVRTLSAEHPAYNPFSYHRGTVWPVENGMFVMALAGCGLYDQMNRLAKAIFESAALFKFQRLPELFGGHPRDEQHPFPALYPRANSPQAWSTTVPFIVIQAMLGIRPAAPERTLYLDPHLPDWLPELHVCGLRVADAVVDLRFFREESGGTSFQVLKQRGALDVVRGSGTPGSRMGLFAKKDLADCG